VSFQHASYQTVSLSCKELKQKNYSVYLVSKTIELAEFVVTASKTIEKKAEVSYQIENLRPNSTIQTPASSSADLLTQNGNITIQKTQGGGGSPILRGFEANKLLLVVDGVRMNNAIYRSGHLQNAITIDNGILERVEVVFGASSVMYGSDALGGSIHYFTKKPQLSMKNEELFTQLNAYSRYSTADDASQFHVDLNLGKKKVASLTSITYKDFGNIKIGKNRDSFADSNYGLTPFFVETIGGIDFTRANADPLVQLNTAYRQYDLLQKLLFSPHKSLDILANFQYSTSGDISRYDFTTEMSGEDLKYAEYHYGPQNRLLASLDMKSSYANWFYSESDVQLSFQRIDEDRITRKFNNTERNSQQEDLWVYSLNVDLVKFFSRKHKLNYGAELVWNTLNSSAFYENSLTGEISPAITRYPNGDNQTQNASLYANYKHFLSEKLIFNVGARYSYAHLYSEFEGEFFEFLEFNTVDISTAAPTAVSGMVFQANENWRLSAQVSTAYRIPNIDDYGKVRAKSGEITIPAKDLNPEFTYNAELNIEKRFWKLAKLNLNVYNTWLKDAIVRSFGTINGSDSMQYDGDWYRVIVNTNAQKAQIYGASLSFYAKYSFEKQDRKTKFVELYSSLNYTKGVDLTENVPMAHIPPLYGKSSVRFSNLEYSFTLWADYNGLKPISDFSPFGEDNAEQATDLGYPAWWTLNFQASYLINERISLQFALENILNKHYKTFASAISAPARNLVLSFRFSI